MPKPITPAKPEREKFKALASGSFKFAKVYNTFYYCQIIVSDYANHLPPIFMEQGSSFVALHTVKRALFFSRTELSAQNLLNLKQFRVIIISYEKGAFIALLLKLPAVRLWRTGNLPCKESGNLRFARFCSQSHKRGRVIHG